MLPLDVIAELLERHGHADHARTFRSLAAREEMRVEAERFWQDVADPTIWAEQDSVAALRLPDPEDDARFRRALRLLAEDLSLRGVASSESEACLARLRTKPPPTD